MTLWAVPPRMKILEALGCIADARIKIDENKNVAHIGSSMRDKTYTVIFNLDNNEIDSDDNGSVFKGYLGYPSIAVLMLKGKLRFDAKIAQALKGIPWKELNEKYKSYKIVEQKVKKKAEEKGMKNAEIDNFVDKILADIEKLGMKKLYVYGSH